MSVSGRRWSRDRRQVLLLPQLMPCGPCDAFLVGFRGVCLLPAWVVLVGHLLTCSLKLIDGFECHGRVKMPTILCIFTIGIQLFPSLCLIFQFGFSIQKIYFSLLFIHTLTSLVPVPYQTRKHKRLRENTCVLRRNRDRHDS